MRTWTLALIGAAASIFNGAGSALAQPALMPMPRSVALKQEAVPFPGGVAPRVAGCGVSLDDAIARFERDLTAQTGIEFDRSRAKPLGITCRTKISAPDSGEGYRLSISNEKIVVDADGPTGVLRALATLRQLGGLNVEAIALPVGTIDDAPRFGWRGIMLDPARHFLSVETIKRQIDAMERVKLNVLHLHLSDDQGFRVESLRYPKLKPADGSWYTQAQIRDLVGYALARGVRIVPEFDVPGHALAIVDAYPSIGVSKPGFFGLRMAALNPGREETFRFLDGLFKEMAGLFPDSHFHVGGDEVWKGSWEGNADVAGLMAREGLADQRAVEGYFHRRVREILHRHGKIMIGWEEVAEHGAPTDVVVQTWQSSNVTASTTAKGYRTIVSAGYYLDMLDPAENHYGVDPASTTAAGITPVEAAQLRTKHPLVAEILTDAKIAHALPPLTPGQAEHVIGGEAPLWGEMVTDELVDARLWPRAAAIAERFWSMAELRDPLDMYRRLSVMQDQLTATGLQDRALQQRLILRLSPGDAAPVETLLAATGPVRNMAHDHRIRAMLTGKTAVQSFNSLADAAPVDSLVARRFTAEARAFLAGDASLAPTIRARLAMWRANEPRFAAIARGKPALEAALPVSARIAELADFGLQALDALVERRKLAPALVAQAEEVLTKTEAEEAASARPIMSFFTSVPPADLIIKIAPGIRALVEAAR